MLKSVKVLEFCFLLVLYCFVSVLISVKLSVEKGDR